jgi:hypothetical protein
MTTPQKHALLERYMLRLLAEMKQDGRMVYSEERKKWVFRGMENRDYTIPLYGSTENRESHKNTCL